MLVVNGDSLMCSVLFSIGYSHVVPSVYKIIGTTWLGVVYGGWTPWVIRLCGRVMTVDVFPRAAG